MERRAGRGTLGADGCAEQEGRGLQDVGHPHIPRPRHVVLLPITHTPPSGDTGGIEIPDKVEQAIGLDDAPSWVIVSEHNIDEWPNGGLSPVPGKRGEFAYGFISPGLFAKNRANFLELARAKKSGAVRR